MTLTTVWNGIALIVYGFALLVAYMLASGQLDPLGSPYYGVVVSWRMSVLFTLLGAHQVLWAVDAVVLARRLRSWLASGLLVLLALFGPFFFVVFLGQVDAWRYEHRSPRVNATAGAAMLLGVVSVYVVRVWAWRRTVPRRARDASAGGSN